MEVLKAILACLTGHDDNDLQCSTACYPYRGNSSTEREDCLAAKIVDIIYASEKHGQSLKDELGNIVHTEGWYETLAKRVLDHLISALKASKVMGKAMKEAYDKASRAAREFAEKHPVYTAAIITIIAIGVLVLVAPWIVEALGFGELGPIEGKQFAYIVNRQWCSWHSLYNVADTSRVICGSVAIYLSRC